MFALYASDQEDKSQRCRRRVLGAVAWNALLDVGKPVLCHRGVVRRDRLCGGTLCKFGEARSMYEM